MAMQRDSVGLATGGLPYQATESVSDPVERMPTLAEADIDKHLADRARKMAAIPVTEFDGIVSGWRDRIEQENERVTVNLLEAGETRVLGRSLWQGRAI
jgi:hypothetical protein